MRIQVQSSTQPATALLALAERRLRFAVRRRADAVPAATVHLDDVNGPKGGPDKQCRIALRTNGSGTIVASAVATTWRGALNAALARAVRLLMRVLGRGQARRRTALPAPGTS